LHVSQEVQDTLNAAFQEAQLKKHEYLTPEHVLNASLHFAYGRQVVKECHGDPDAIRDQLARHLAEKLETVPDAVPGQSSGFQNVITRAAMAVEHAGRDDIEMGDILVALYDEEKSFGSYFMKKAGITRLGLLEVISHVLGRSEAEMREIRGESDESGGGPGPGAEGGAEGGAPDPADAGQGGEAKGGKSPQKILAQFTRELVAAAGKGELDPLIGRQDLLERTMQILCRRLKNNPVFLGDPGVGKTAIADGLAQRIATGNVPDLLKGFRIHSLDMGAVVAGTHYRGDFEERFKNILKALEDQPKSILFIDEIHTLVRAGAVEGGAMDASNLLKPALASGRLRVIGASTGDEFRKFMERDKALARRFQTVDVTEPSEAEAVQILQGLRTRFEDYHRVRYSDAALELAVRLSAQYINDRRLPDKAIDVIDECGALMHLKTFKLEPAAEGGDPEPSGETGGQQTGTAARPSEDERAAWPLIDVADVELVVSRIARIPERTVNTSEKDKLKTLEAELRRQVFGQDEAVREVAQAIKKCRAGFRKAAKPVANFLFVGPTGVGKTELARQLAANLGVELIRFDMSEYQEQHTVSRLIGSPPGYVGYDEGGQLTEAIRKNPHAVLLLDEIEKAHQQIFNVLLPVMDYATLTDNSGRKADFRNVIIIMTSNAGAREIGKPLIGFGSATVTESAVGDAVNRTFSPEFRNRLDKVIQFKALDTAIVANIVRKELREFELQLADKAIRLEVTDEAVEWLAATGYSAEFGARNIGRLVDDQVRSAFIDEVLFGRLEKGGLARISLAEGKIAIAFEPGAQLEAPEEPATPALEKAGA
jgi:ATP-dependent Clp protease ATP-binding subunit ClpA